MIIRIKNRPAPAKVMMQTAGYYEFQDPNTGEISYVRRTGTQYYPRFHAYIVEDGPGYRINIHLDQKQASYEGFTKHNGEYDGPVIEAEAARIYSAIVTT